ncbi:MAG: hypothetical protein AAF799_13830 [Myxococcota bacterium]
MVDIRVHSATLSVARSFVSSLTQAGLQVDRAPGLRFFAGTYAPWQGEATARYGRNLTPTYGLKVLDAGVSSLDAVGESWTGEAVNDATVPPAASSGAGPWTRFPENRFHQHGLIVLRQPSGTDPAESPSAETMAANLFELQLVRQKWYALLRKPIPDAQRTSAGWPMHDVLLQLEPGADNTSGLGWSFVATTRISLHPEAFTHIAVFHTPAGVEASDVTAGHRVKLANAGSVLLPADTQQTPGPGEAWLMLRFDRQALGARQLTLRDDQSGEQRASARTAPTLGDDRVALRFVVGSGRRYTLTMGTGEGSWPLFENADLSQSVQAAVANEGQATFPAGLVTLGFPNPTPTGYGRVQVDGEEGAYDDLEPDDHDQNFSEDTP